MKRLLGLSALVLAGSISFPAVANAGDWGFDIGFRGHRGQASVHYRDRDHRRYRERDHRRYRQHNARRYRHARHYDNHHSSKVWVAPVYDRVFSGYDHCGNPIYRTVVVRPGYYTYH